MIATRSLPNRMPALDGLRAVAIMMVIGTHAFGGWQAAQSLTQQTLAWPATFHLPGWLSAIAGAAVHGVTLFFVVSAFTLTIQAGRRHDGWAAYAVRRIARVGPGYWLAGLAYTLVAGFTPRLWAPNGVTLSDLAVAALFGSAWQGGSAMAVVPGGWSVCCEVAFYAALPTALWLCRGRWWRAAILTAVAAIGLQLVARASMRGDGWHYVPDYIHPAAQAPVFLCGITAALLVRQCRVPRLPGAAVMLLALAVCGVPFSPLPEWHLLPHLLFAALAAGAAVLAAVHPPRLLASGFMRRIGEVSYSMYLVHFALLAPSLWLAEEVVPADDWRTLTVHTALTSVASFGAACLTFRWIEQPGIQLGAMLVHRLRSSADPVRSA